MLSVMEARIHMPTAEHICTTGELVGPTLIRLDSFAGPLPLGPGDVLRLVHGPDGPMATGVEDLKRQWIVELHARTPHDLEPDDTAWEAAQLAADLMVDGLAEFPHMMRTTRFSALVVSGSWGRVGSFIRANPHVGQYEIYRDGSVASLDWDALMADSWQMDRPLFDRTGQRID